MKKNRILKSTISSALLMLGFAFGLDVGEYTVHGRAWTDMGRIITSKDTLIANDFNTLDLNNNGLFSMGGQFTLKAQLSDNCKGAFGFGAHRVNHSTGNDKNAFLSIAMFQSFLTESNATCGVGEKEGGFYSGLTVGTYQYKYNDNVKNLGLYLLRGPVYPGLLMGGWDDPYADDLKAPFLGAMASVGFGDFTLDVLLNSERDVPPTFDWSLALIGQYDFGGVAQWGLGTNFYRLIPYNDAIITPGKTLDEPTLNFELHKYLETDTITGETTYYTHQGTKVSSFFAIDFKKVLGMQNESRDLIFYTELALIGVKDYGTFYADKSQRMPLMFGFNFPTFGLLDLFSIELEWYGSKYKNDLARIGYNNVVADWTRQPKPIPAPTPVRYEDYGIESESPYLDSVGSPIIDPASGSPVYMPPFYVSNLGDTTWVAGTSLDVENITTDDWKWSINVEKVVKNHIGFHLQIASDHYRPKPYATGLISAAGGTATAFNNTSDWYLMFRTSFLF